MKQHLTKRFLALFLSLVMVLGLLPVTALAAERSYDGTEQLYVDLGAVSWWQDNSPTQRAYFFGENGIAWALLEPEEGTVYKTAVPAGTWTHVILVRCNPAYQGEDYWSADSKWNQTGDIALDSEKNFLQSFGENSAEAVWGTWPAEAPEPVTEPPVTEPATETTEPTPAEPEYYLVGSMNDWTPAEAYRLAPGQQEGQFLLTGVELAANATLKITDKANDIWYPDGVGNDYTVTEAGTYDLEFYPAGEKGEDFYYGFFQLTKQEAPPAELQEISLPNGDFETGDTTNWVISGLPENPVRQNQWNEPNTSWTLNLWASDTEQVEIHAKYPVKLTAGRYKFSFDLSGEGKDSNLRWTVYAGDQVLARQDGTVTTVDWNVWNTVETDEFTLDADTEVCFDFGGTGPVKYWGDLDNLKLFGTGSIVGQASELEPDHQPTLAVEKVPGVDAEDFMRGTDVSSFLSILNSGAKFYDYEGNQLDGPGFFALLASAGFNYIRLRVWNDPFDANGNGYGGGNCDVDAAKTMGKWASDAGMKVLIDFHYSDFWADPGKQKVPKAWSGYTADQKAEAVDAFTYNSLKTLLEAGVNVGMVQVGNETTSSICGESSWTNKAKIFSAGSAAVRRIAAEKDHPILVAIHFTNPERSGNYASQAKNLKDNNVDYDVFASSWYPYWHGTTSNLSSVLKQVADTYGKQVVVAETSWAWTLADGDGHDNTVRTGNNDANAAYPFSQQGQADELVAATKAVTAVGEAGIGVFYWENAWIPVQYAYDENGAKVQSIVESNKQKWEQFGSGWASSYAAEYDPNDAGKWYGGSAVDNQAMFDFQGKALDSLWTWQYMMIGTDDLMEKQVEEIETLKLSIDQGASLSLPETVKVTYNVGGTKDEPVTWNAEELAAVDVNTPGSYTVHGAVILSYELGTGETQAEIIVNYPNLLQNPSFELSDMSMYSYSGGSRTGDDPHSGSRSFHFYNANGGTVELSQSIVLAPGSYRFSLFTQGDAKGSTDMYIYVKPGDSEPLTQSFALAGWAVWQNPEIEFELTQNTEVTVGIHLAYGAGGWGTIDDLYLGGESEPLSDEVAVFFVDMGGHEAINYYAFGPDNAQSAEWPGTPLESLGVTEDDFKIYRINLDSGLYDHVIFNDGSWQTGNLAVVDSEHNLPFAYGSFTYVVYKGEDTAEDLFMVSARVEPGCEEEGSITLQSLISGEIVTEAVPALGHEWSEWNVTQEPTCTQAGERSRTCARCQETETEELPALDGEALADAIAQAEALDSALYTEESFAALTEALAAAKEVYQSSHSQEAVDAAAQALLAAIQALEQKPEAKPVTVFYVDELNLESVSWYAFGPNGAESAPWPGTAMSSDLVDQNNHKIYQLELDASTYSSVIFTDGGNWQTQDLPLEGEYNGKLLPFSYQELSYIVYFGNSSEADEQGHYKAWPAEELERLVSKTEPSCTEAGVTVLESMITGETRQIVAEALGHEWSEWTVTQEPTCAQAGERSRTCARCQETETEELPALDGEALAAAIAQAEALDEALYTEESFAALTEALNAARDAYQNAHSQQVVDAAAEALLAAIAALEEKPEPAEPEYYLFGWINGADYPTEGLGEYKFENGQLTVTFTEDSYVAVQTDTGKRYMTDGWLGNVNEAILYDADTITTDNKLWAPGGVELVFTLTVNEDGTLKLAHNGEIPQPQEPVYYLVGSMNEWTASEEYKLLPGENEGEFVLTGITLTAGTEVKVLDQPNDLWYPNNNYQITEDGSYDVSFYPNGTEQAGYADGVLKLTKQEEPQPEPNPIDVYYVDEADLTGIFCYAFDMLGSSVSAEWPGTALEALGQDRNGHKVYKVTLDASLYTHVIFTDGSGWQTQDLPFGEDANENNVIVYFGNSSEADEQGHYKAWPAEDVEKIVSRTEPSCTEPGALVLESFVTGQQRTEVLEALGHNPGAETKENETAPTCTEAGAYDLVIRCTRCNEILSSTHVTVDALGHEWDEGVVTAPPTALQPGVRTYTCLRCGETRTEEIPKLKFLFDDVQDPDRFYYKAVYWAYNHDPQITKGTSETEFSPEKSCTRAEVVTFLWRAAGCPKPASTENPFTDVENGKFYSKAVLWAVEQGITKGTTKTTFSPNGACTRSQVVTFLWRAMKKPASTVTTTKFTDVNTKAFYYKAMLWALGAGITKGTSKTTFSPDKVCTRGEVVTFLMRAYEPKN